jgi:hypothetical protein
LTKNPSDLSPDEPIEVVESGPIQKTAIWWRFEPPVFEIPIDLVNGKVMDLSERSELPSDLILRFPMGTTLTFPVGKVTLIFSEWHQQVRLSYFLHYLIHSYLSATNSRPVSRILYIETVDRSLQFRHLINFLTPPAALQSLFFVTIDDVPTLTQFVETQLPALLTQLKIQLVIFPTLFELFEEQVAAETLSPFQFRDRLREKELKFIRKIIQLAQDTNTSVLITRNGMLFDDWTERIEPFLPRQVRDAIKNRLFFYQTKTRFHLIPVGFGDIRNAVKQNVTYIYRPPIDRQFIFPFFKLLDLPFQQLLNVPSLIDLTVAERDPWAPLTPQLQEHPRIQETFYGLKFLVCRFKSEKGWIENVDTFLEQDSRARFLDIICWPTGNYSIYNNTVDLTVLKGPERYGGLPLKERKGMFFKLGNPGVRSFEEFLKTLTHLFLEFRQLVTFLTTIQADFKTYMEQEAKTSRDSEEIFTEEDIEGISQELLSIFGSFPPLHPENIPEIWKNTMTELHLYFTWKQVENIMSLILDNLELSSNFIDIDTVKDAIQDGLRKGLWYQTHKKDIK